MSKIMPPRADPNHYYLVLGLDPHKPWSDDDIRRAFREQAKRLHPDGSDPDPVLYDRLQVAYSVLRDPELRAKYDALEANKMWQDKDVIALIIKKMAEARVRGGKVAEVAPMLKEALERTEPAKPPPGPSYDTYAYYYYDGEEVPERAIREEWAELMIRACWGLGKTSEIRLGFTTGVSHAVDKTWGRVLMASGKPSAEAAYALAELLGN